MQGRTKVTITDYRNRKSYTRFRLVPKSVTLNNLERRIQGLPKVFKYALLSQERVKLRTLIRPVHSQDPSEQKTIKILGKRERGRIQGLPKVLNYPLLSQERVKLRTSNLSGTFKGTIRTKAH